MQRIFVADSADELMRNTHDFLSPFGETNRICQVLPCSTMQCASNTPTWTQRLQNKFWPSIRHWGCCAFIHVRKCSNSRELFSGRFCLHCWCNHVQPLFCVCDLAAPVFYLNSDECMNPILWIHWVFSQVCEIHCSEKTWCWQMTCWWVHTVCLHANSKGIPSVVNSTLNSIVEQTALPTNCTPKKFYDYIWFHMIKYGCTLGTSSLAA